MATRECGRLQRQALDPLGPALREAGAKAVLIDIAPQRGLPFDVVESKVRPPPIHAGTVSRPALVNRLRAAGAFPLVFVVAPAGYGKTKLLAQWAAKDARPTAWVSIDERDNDPLVLLRHVAAALDAIEGVDPSLIDALRSPGESVWTAAVPRLAAAVAARPASFLIVLDDAHILRSEDSVAVVAAIAEHVPEGSMLALAGRGLPRLPIARLRVRGPLLEIGPYELAFSRREAEILLRASAANLGDDEVASLLERTEGWAAGLYLAALAARRTNGGGSSGSNEVELTGDDRYLADYFRSEHLSRLAPELLTFLRRTSVLERMSGPLCDAVLEGDGSALELESIEQSNLFLVPLDCHRQWYRYHHLFRDALKQELGEHEPELVPELNRRAADWFEADGDLESALEHAHACGDRARAARILASIALTVYYGGRVETLEAWLDRFAGEVQLERYPAVAVHGSRIHALRGRTAEAERWLAAAERGVAAKRNGSAEVRPWIAVMRAAMCRDGAEHMLADARSALTKLAEDSPWAPSALLVRGAAHLLLGHDDRADEALSEAALSAERLGWTETRVVALSERSLLAAARKDHALAEEFAVQAHDLVEDGKLGGYASSALELAASARASLRHGRWDEARSRLAIAERLVPSLTHAVPWLAVQARLELARAYVTLRDIERARVVTAEAREILRTRRGLGVLAKQAAALQQELESTVPEVGERPAGLTGAELRLLPLLATHLSFREIGAKLFVSRNTIKTQAISVYRKLGVSSRSEAIDQAAELGLVQATTPAAIESPRRGAVRMAAS